MLFFFLDVLILEFEIVILSVSHLLSRNPITMFCVFFGLPSTSLFALLFIVSFLSRTLSDVI